MKNLTLKLAVMGTLGLVSAQAMATGFVSIPAAGSAVAANFNYAGSPAGTTAYVLCNTTGDFGAGTTTPPTTLANNTCAVFPANEFTTPIAGYTLVTSASRPIVVNNTYTGGTAKTVGNVQEYVWRDSASSTSCIYGAKATMVATGTADYLPATGTQNFEINDISRGGFAGLAVEAAYFRGSSTAEVVFRIGRTFTAVQHRSHANYAELPLTTPAYALSINGIDAWPTPAGGPVAAEQSASLNDNWVSFTTDANVNDDDGTTKAASSMTYVKAACTSAAPVAVAEAIRVRQTFQELSGDGVSANRFIEAAVSGFVPPGGAVAPAHVDPY